MKNGTWFTTGLAFIVAWFLLSQGSHPSDILKLGIIFVVSDVLILVGKSLWVLYKKPWRD